MIYMDEEIHLTDLITVETLQKIQDSFSKATPYKATNKITQVKLNV